MSEKKTIHKERPEQGRATFSDEQLRVFGDIALAFDEWYRANYDERGRYVWARLLELRRREVQDEQG